MGAFDTRNSSLPVLTLVIAGMDSFNPCTFFVLLSLLGLLVHARSRNKMLLIGGAFVFFSGFIYFLFMAAWLNLFLVLYNIVYVVPLFVIVLGFTLTLGKRQLSEWQGRVLKLVSGAMMLGLGGVLLVNPALLNSVKVSFVILVSALGVSLLVATVTKRLGRC